MRKNSTNNERQKEAKLNSVKENSQIGKNTYITLCIKTDPIWLEFKKKIKSTEGMRQQE